MTATPQMYRDVSIDCETLSLANHPYLLSVALVTFDVSVPSLRHGPVWYWRLKGEQAGADIAPDVVEWWMKQDAEIRAEAFGALIDRVSDDRVAFIQNDPTPTRLATFLQELTGALALVQPDRIWVRGIDHVWLESHFRAAGLPVPWGFRKIVDLRSVETVATEAGYLKPESEHGGYHSAYHDAIAQADDARKVTAWMRAPLIQVP